MGFLLKALQVAMVTHRLVAAVTATVVISVGVAEYLTKKKGK